MRSNCTLLEIVDILAQNYGEGGICNSPSSYPKIIALLNKAIPPLMTRIDSKYTIADWMVPVWSQEFTLPIDCLEPRQVWLNGESVEQRDGWYEGKLGVGLQPERGCPCCEGHQLIDKGDGWALPYKWPPHFDTRLGFLSENDGDAGAGIQVRVIDRNRSEVCETVTLNANQQLAVTNSDVTDVRFIRKGLTKGQVRAYIYYPQTAQAVWTGTFPSFVQVPTYRKKKLPHWFPRECTGVLVIKGKIRFFPIQSETDPLPITNGMGLAFAMKAVSAQARNDVEGFDNYMARAVKELDEELKDSVAPAVVSQASFKSPYGRRAFQKVWR
jgi:hypothetical protein